MKCIVVDDEDVARKVVKSFIERTKGLTVVADFDNAIDAYNLLKSETVDLLFLDIDMPEMSGMELIKSLENKPMVVMITGRKEFAIEAYELAVVDYMVKPVTYARFLKAVEKVTGNMSKNVLDTTAKGDIYVKADSKIVRISLKDIKFVEALSDYVIIHTDKKKYIVHSTMKGITNRLPAGEFARVHRSFIVNINQIETIEDMSNIIMPNKIIPIGASYKSDFFNKLNFL